MCTYMTPQVNRSQILVEYLHLRPNFLLLLSSQALSSFQDLVRNGPDHPATLDMYTLGALKRLGCQMPPQSTRASLLPLPGLSPPVELSKRMDGVCGGCRCCLTV